MRLIDADELKELFAEVISGIAKKPEITKDLEHMVRASAMVIQMIDDAPTIEAEPIVRCKYCINWQTDWRPSTVYDGHYCAFVDTTTKENFYCAYAERRTDGTDRKTSGDQHSRHDACKMRHGVPTGLSRPHG